MKIFHILKLKKWAKSHDIPEDILEELIYFQPRKSVYIEASKKMEPTPPLDYIGNIIRNNSDEFFDPPTPIEQRLFVIGACPNGDFVVIDLKEDIGSVKYVDHEQIFETNDFRSISIKISESLYEFIELYVEEENFPFDYYDALNKSEPGVGVYAKDAQ